MALKAIYDKQDDIPEAFRELYAEKGGKFELSGIEGVKTVADVERVQVALNKERADHKAVKDKLAAWGDLNHEEVLAKLDKLPELEAAAAGKIDENKLNEMVEARVKGRTSPLERQIAKLTQDLTSASETIKGFQGKERQRAIHDAVRAAAVASKVVESAMEDVLLLGERVFEVAEDGKVVTRDGVGATPGSSPEAWLSEIQQKRPHWWPPSQGGGAGGSGPQSMFAGRKNPWSTEHWNLTEQGRVIRELGQEKAEQMAKAAGSHIGATRPAKKAA